MNFAAILSIMKYDQYHNKCSFVVRILKSAEAISGAMSWAVTRGDFGKWSAFFSGTLTPEIAKHLLADLVANLEFINANAMHESITIKEHGAESKYVFFPKGDLYGRWGLNLAVRILSIYTDPSVLLSATVLRNQEAAEVRKSE